MVAFGCCERLDGLRNDVLQGMTFGVSDKRDKTLPKFLQEMEEKERSRTGLTSLKILETKNFGFCISLPLKISKAVKLPEDYERRQTLSNEERYSTPALAQAENRIIRASQVLFIT